MSAFIDAHREDFGVELICRTIGTSASAYHQRASGERSERDVEDARLLGVIRRVHADNYEAYGSRRMWKALRREGESTGRGRVERLMARNAIVGAKRRGKPWRTTVPGAAPVSTPDLLGRDFTASRPNERWCADFTYLRCWSGVLFLSFVVADSIGRCNTLRRGRCDGPWIAGVGEGGPGADAIAGSSAGRAR